MGKKKKKKENFNLGWLGDKYNIFVFEYYKESLFPPQWLCDVVRAIGEDKNKAMLNMRHSEYAVRKYCKMLLNGTLDTELERLDNKWGNLNEL